jgi:DNA (cytosine-5)-methyltransferase 1
MGFPDTHVIPVSDVQAYKQFGNSVVVPMMQSIAVAMLPDLADLTDAKRSIAS